MYLAGRRKQVIQYMNGERERERERERTEDLLRNTEQDKSNASPLKL